jgi:hypothetical protein
MSIFHMVRMEGFMASPPQCELLYTFYHGGLKIDREKSANSLHTVKEGMERLNGGLLIQAAAPATFPELRRGGIFHGNEGK